MPQGWSSSMYSCKCQFNIPWNSIAELPFAAEGLNVTCAFLYIDPLVQWHLSCAMHSVMWQVRRYLKIYCGFNVLEPWSVLKKFLEDFRNNRNLYTGLWGFVSWCKPVFFEPVAFFLMVPTCSGGCLDNAEGRWTLFGLRPRKLQRPELSSPGTKKQI